MTVTQPTRPSLQAFELDYQTVRWADTLDRWPTRPDDENRYLSTEQIDRIANVLRDLPQLLEDLEIAITKDVRFPPRKIRPRLADEPLPGPFSPADQKSASEAGVIINRPPVFNASASQARSQIGKAVTVAAIHVWNRLAPGVRHKLADPLDAAEWLHGQLDQLALDPEAEKIGRRIVSRVRHGHHVIDHPREIRYLGICPKCGADLEVEHGDDTIVCQQIVDTTGDDVVVCGWFGAVDVIIADAIKASRDALFTDSELVGVFELDGRQVTRNQINSWSRSGRLAPHEQKRWNKHSSKIESRRTYRLSDVQALVDELERKRSRAS